MHPDVAQLAQLLIVIGTFTLSMVGVAVVARKAFQQPRVPKAREQGAVIDEARFSRLEDAVETIAIEVERIAEAQRFSAKLLAERARETSSDNGRALQDPISRT